MQNLNWKEIEICATYWSPPLIGARLERIIVPKRPESPLGFLKNEWVLRFQKGGETFAFWISLQGGTPWCSLEKGKGPKASQVATHARFDLEAGAALKGKTLSAIRSLPRDRVLILEFSTLWIVIFLIPNRPEILFVDSGKIRASNRATRTLDAPWEIIPSQAPELSLRENFPPSFEAFHLWIQEEERKKVLEQRKSRILSLLNRKEKELKRGLLKNETALQETLRQADPMKQAELLKAHLHFISIDSKNRLVTLTDYETQKEIQIKIKEGRTPKEEMEFLFQKGKRNRRKVEDLTSRIQLYQKKLTDLNALKELPNLEQIEKELGISSNSSSKDPTKKIKRNWPGRCFISKEGFEIWVGRTREDNIDLTFRKAKGEDTWLHIRGAPSSHVVIPNLKGKSIPLETLLDAAHLLVYFSIGVNRGKVDVDYTKKKFLKRIKGADEVFYTNQKTLVIEVDRTRINRLLGKETL